MGGVWGGVEAGGGVEARAGVEARVAGLHRGGRLLIILHYHPL